MYYIKTCSIFFISLKHNKFERYSSTIVGGDFMFHVIAAISWILIFTIVIVMIVQMVQSNKLENEERKVAIEERKKKLRKE